MSWYALKFSPPLDAISGSMIASLPGIRLHGNSSASCPDHLVDIVATAAKSLGINVTASAPRSGMPSRTVESIPLLRAWVPKFLTHYQREGVEHALNTWSLSRQSGLFIWSAGSGKTLASQAWACAVGEAMRTVVVTKSAVKFQWRDEADRFTEAASEVLEGQKPGPLPSRGFVILGYEILAHWAEEIARWKPHSVIFDESHKAKSNQRWSAAVAKASAPTVERNGDPFSPVAATITPAAPEVTFALKGNHAGAAFIVSRAAQRRLATTATPVRDRVRDFWAQLDLVRPGEFGSYRGPRDARNGFVWRYCAARDGQFGGIDDKGQSNLEELKARLRSVCHYVPFSVANRELPPKRRVVTLVRTAEQNRSSAVADDIRRAARVGEVAARRAAIIEARLWEAASRKRKRLGDLVAQAIEAGQKVVVFTGRRRDCDELQTEIAARIAGLGIDKTCLLWTAHGGHADSMRRQIQKDYMAAPGPAVLIGTSDAWGEGLNLQDTDLLLVAMLPYTPGQVIQIEGRVVRLGMTRNPLIQYLVAESTIDERVAQILLRKLPAIGRVMDSAEEVDGIAHELSGADDETLIKDLAAMVLQDSA